MGLVVVGAAASPCFVADLGTDVAGGPIPTSHLW